MRKQIIKRQIVPNTQNVKLIRPFWEEKNGKRKATCLREEVIVAWAIEGSWGSSDQSFGLSVPIGIDSSELAEWFAIIDLRTLDWVIPEVARGTGHESLLARFNSMEVEQEARTQRLNAQERARLNREPLEVIDTDEP